MLNVANEPRRLRPSADAIAERRDRRADIGETRVPVDERRDAAPAADATDEFRLGDVDDDEIRLERQDALEVRIQQRADARSRRRLGRIRVEARNADHLDRRRRSRRASR